MKATTTPTVYSLKIELRWIEPKIWRRVLVKDCSLAKLHLVIQVLFNWTGEHLHLFEVKGKHFGEPGFEGYDDEHRVRLSGLAEGGIKKFRYIYDFGDDWQHEISIGRKLRAQNGVHYPHCAEGARAGPPEDSGGAPGYAQYLDALANPRDPDHAERLEWLGDYDPEEFDIDFINTELRALR